MTTLSPDTINLPLAPAPRHPPVCFLCNSPSQRLTTRYSNPNGNAGRPFHKCTNCQKFLVFADERGNFLDNPQCHCGESSKAQIAGRNSRNPGGLHYVCRLGTCDYYAIETD
ncbi:uncharacterized protein BKA55DRAFT_586364 [Fusarium redolens]|uniref:GRF-like zinc ribbon domain-containing protein n=1 Tax=Fusarium redolens TaxID=48865 RepID=A0A9P9FWF3_FUSRE|nr:uncharacterized protein BKA55DRAFT_586364 [Fusarium redolens]KAH7207875.1 hypothetical protein BKA55DRAFT_586364 [Fusarium redolens]